MASNTEPLVACVCLTADRQELTERAVRCFEAQTYSSSWLVILDTGATPFKLPHGHGDGIMLMWVPQWRGQSIGMLRNEANTLAPKADIIAHLDSDDWIHPSRLTEQVAFLQASGAEAVGYNELLFWRTSGEAWLYSRQGSKPYALGTSLVYWRKTWEHHPFTHAPKNPEATSEYQHWNVGAVKLASCSSFGEPLVEMAAHGTLRADCSEPRMVARIHGGNTSRGYDLEKKIAGGSRDWYRVPQWDQRVREILK